MTTKAQTKRKHRRTTMVPVTTMEEVPILSEVERKALLASLERAQERVKAGKGVEHDPEMFKNRLMAIYRGSKR